jgi:two-component sensor histidine kinase
MPEQYREGHPHLRQGYLERPKVHMMARGRDLHALHKDGSQFPVEISLNPVQTEKGIFVLGSIVDLTERKRHEADIRAALNEKEVLLREVYHRVKNNLQVIQSLLSLRSRTLPEGLARSVMLESVQRVRAMALVHEKLYQSDNLERISLPDYVAGLFRQLMEAYGRHASQGQVALQQDIAAVNIGLERAVPLGLLLTELISNCLKHGFSDGRPGEVHVTLKEVESGIRLSVADNGIGIEPGHNPLEGKSMGLTLVVSLAQQLNGKLDWKTGPDGRGLEITLDMPPL